MSWRMKERQENEKKRKKKHIRLLKFKQNPCVCAAHKDSKNKPRHADGRFLCQVVIPAVCSARKNLSQLCNLYNVWRKSAQVYAAASKLSALEVLAKGVHALILNSVLNHLFELHLKTAFTPGRDGGSPRRMDLPSPAAASV